MCANETAIHQLKAVHYIATVYTMHFFQRSAQNKYSYCIFSVRLKLPRLTPFSLALVVVGTHPSH